MNDLSLKPAIKKRWNIWGYNALDLVLLGTGLTTIITISIVFEAQWLIIVNSILGILCVFTQAKGKIATQFIGVVWFAFYCFLAYQNQYYGEVILYAAILIPLYLYGIVHWLKNRDKADNTVIVRSRISTKEILISLAIFLPVCVGIFFMLQALNTAELWLSTLGFCTMLPSVYLLVRRNKWNQLMFLINDVILLFLWQVLVFNGRLEFLAVLGYQIFQIIYDSYGMYVWSKLEKRQKEQAQNASSDEKNNENSPIDK